MSFREKIRTGLNFKKYHSRIILFFIGGLAGYFIFHPYTMIVYFFTHTYRKGDIVFSWHNLISAFSTTLTPAMILMSVAFTIFGSLIGLFAGIIIDKKKRLHAAEIENERKKAALETLQRLMVTLSHYLLNANTVIGGIARRSQKCNTMQKIIESLSIIDEESRKIESVIKALRKITEIKTANYTSEGHNLMIDITKEIDEILKSEKEGNDTRKSLYREKLSDFD